MFTFFMVLFIILSIFLAIFILIQQGKGDMGLGGLGGSTQMLFGGSGGQGFFEKTTWVLGFIFILGSLGLAVLKSKENRKSSLEGFKVQDKRSMLPELPASLPSNGLADAPVKTAPTETKSDASTAKN